MVSSFESAPLPTSVVAFGNVKRVGLVLTLVSVAGCPSSKSSDPGNPDARVSEDDAGATADADVPAGTCPADGSGLDCLFNLYDQVTSSCDQADLERLQASLDLRNGQLPAWHQGRALFVSYDQAVGIAGGFSDWQVMGQTQPVCDTGLHVADLAIESGRHPYKLVVGESWVLDPLNWAFAYDDFGGNPDGRNSLLNTYDSGLGHLVQPPSPLCSAKLDNCRLLTTYLPAGYHSPAMADQQFPVLFMHDGQNIFDDTDCCFGHTGWEVNRAIDEQVADNQAAPLVVVGFDHGGPARINEYGGDRADAFIDFQLSTVQPTAAGLWRLDASRYYTVGSSLGGLIAFRLALEHPEVYAGAGSLSGAFWFGKQFGPDTRDLVSNPEDQPLLLYLDHGGTFAGGGDDMANSIELRDHLVDKGWQLDSSPECTSSSGTVCYFHAEGATHDELAWRERAWRFVRVFAPPQT